MIELQQVGKRFDRQLALRSLDLTAGPEEVYALLGEWRR